MLIINSFIKSIASSQKSGKNPPKRMYVHMWRSLHGLMRTENYVNHKSTNIGVGFGVSMSASSKIVSEEISLGGIVILDTKESGVLKPFWKRNVRFPLTCHLLHYDLVRKERIKNKTGIYFYENVPDYYFFLSPAEICSKCAASLLY